MCSCIYQFNVKKDRMHQSLAAFIKAALINTFILMVLFVFTVTLTLYIMLQRLLHCEVPSALWRISVSFSSLFQVLQPKALTFWFSLTRLACGHRGAFRARCLAKQS